MSTFLASFLLFLVLFALLLIPVYLQFKGIINTKISITQIITLLLLSGFLIYFIYESMREDTLKDNLIIILLLSLYISFKMNRLLKKKEEK